MSGHKDTTPCTEEPMQFGCRVHYETQGSGTPVVLIPGLGGDGRYWDPAAALLERHFQLIIVDHRVARPSFVPLLDPLGNLVRCGQGSHVRHVIIDGIVRVRDGHAVGVDEERICRQAQEAAERLWRQAA